jgi:hypothetical protein
MTGGGETRATLALRPWERAWAEALFASVLGPTEDEGLPSFESVDRTVFWRALESAPAPTFGPGLRAMVHGLTFLPVLDVRYGKPFFALDRAARARFIEGLHDDPRYLVRQMLATMKMLACFAYFDDPAVRARYRPEWAG